jgi:hypothetical protein
MPEACDIMWKKLECHYGYTSLSVQACALENYTVNFRELI